MINGTFEEFFKFLYQGGEMILELHGKKYFVEAGGTTKYGEWMHMIVMYPLIVNENRKDENNVYWSQDYPKNEDGFFWSVKSDDAEANIRAFLEAPIFEEQKFMHVQKYVTWTDEA